MPNLMACSLEISLCSSIDRTHNQSNDVAFPRTCVARAQILHKDRQGHLSQADDLGGTRDNAK